ncbi:rhomboid family intramembrane serine protease [Rhodococcus sp. G-MC3]|uniref:rhomboid family intramembrane serine protease n=1 Tax=Rhodococcus sp. G-MC3 TaxID=3046209 RepID=UPI0024BAAEE3|nr:rhomboid family intramembrane serine protease [Rhodococcus sp. G-MC3]MDJ0396294.1 rhomboid family intramembrane serine protease [Rhodococcus sp. G-MC3]
MTTNPYLPAPTSKRPLWQSAAMYTGGFVVLLWVIELIDVASGSRIEDAGINPRTVDGLWGILFAPVLHDDWAHLIANTVPLLVLGFLVLLSGIGRGLTATGIIWIVAGVGTWLIGGAYSNHIGASSLVFGFIAYLLTRGIFARNIGQLALGVVVFVIYGGALWGVLPSTPGISWQGHFFGAVGGVVAAWALSSDAREARRQKAVGPAAL